MWLTAAVTVSVPNTQPGMLAVAVRVASSSELFTVVTPNIWDKSSDIKIGQWGRPWLVWYVPCKRRCVPRFTKLKTPTSSSHWMIVADAVKLEWVSRNSVTVRRWTARRYFHCLRRTITWITDKITVICVTTIPCIDPADLSINISD